MWCVLPAGISADLNRFKGAVYFQIWLHLLYFQRQVCRRVFPPPRWMRLVLAPPTVEPFLSSGRHTRSSLKISPFSVAPKEKDQAKRKSSVSAPLYCKRCIISLAWLEMVEQTWLHLRDHLRCAITGLTPRPVRPSAMFLLLCIWLTCNYCGVGRDKKGRCALILPPTEHPAAPQEPFGDEKASTGLQRYVKYEAFLCHIVALTWGFSQSNWRNVKKPRDFQRGGRSSCTASTSTYFTSCVAQLPYSTNGGFVTPCLFNIINAFCTTLHACLKMSFS